MKPSFYVCLKEGECGQKLHVPTGMKVCGKPRPWRCPHAKHLSELPRRTK